MKTLNVLIDSFDAAKQNPTYEFLVQSRDQAKKASLAYDLPGSAPITPVSFSGG